MKRRRLITNIVIYTLLLLGSMLFIIPFYWLVRSSLMEMGQIFVLPPIWIPNPVRFSNYYEAMTILPFGRYFLNTLIIVVGGVVGVLATASISAYSFSRIRWKRRNLVFGILMTSMMLPYAVTLIPTFIGWKFVGGINTFLPLIARAWFGGSVFDIFLMRQFFMTLPKELDEAAVMDGGGHFTIFAKIIVPLSRPAFVAVGLFAFLGYWNDFLGPLVYLNNQDMYTLSLGLQQFQGMYNAQWHLMMAAATVIVAPTIIVFFLGQRYFVEGIALTGLKG